MQKIFHLSTEFTLNLLSNDFYSILDDLYMYRLPVCKYNVCLTMFMRTIC